MEITAPSKGTRGKCDACGDTPVAHVPTYLMQSFEAIVADRLDHSRSRLLSRAIGRVQHVSDSLFETIPRAMHATRLARTAHDPAQACSYRSQVIWEEAARRGIPMEQLTVFSNPTELYRAHIAGTWHYFHSLPVPPALWRDMYQGIDDKERLKRFLHERGIPVSRAERARTLEAGYAIFEKFQKPVVVKPRFGSRARHTTTNIHAREDFAAAFALAQQLCRDVLVEEHLDGAISRATVVDGVMRGFLQMYQARLTGDGVHTILQLLEEKNATRPDRVAAIALDAEHIAYLKRSGYTPESIIPSGVRIDLSRRTGRFEGGRTHEMPERVHPALRAYVEKAAHELRTPIVGFDLIIADAEADPDSQEWGILEANSLPYIDLHHAPLEGKPSNIAGAIWDLWDSAQSRGAIMSA